MKLRNKKTGEIVDTIFWDDEAGKLCVCGNKLNFYNSLTELNEEWEDYEENECYYAITSVRADGGISMMKNIHNYMNEFDKSIGNYFETKEEAEKAVEKLKAWKRLKDAGFRFVGWDSNYGHFRASFKFAPGDDRCLPKDDLDLLFGGDE